MGQGKKDLFYCTTCIILDVPRYWRFEREGDALNEGEQSAMVLMEEEEEGRDMLQPLGAESRAD